jgi:HAD superfamily hydrolase (TIGR01490 family)
VLSAYRRAGQASAKAGTESSSPHEHAYSAAFFDLDNTIIRGASVFHIAVGLAKRKYFTISEIAGFAVKQIKFVVSGSEDLEDIASVTEAALSFVQGRSVEELNAFGETIFNESMVDKLIPGSLALAQAHLDAGQQVWLVTATPVELATMVARRLGLTGALGTVSEVKNGIYTGRLNGPPLHGLAKAEAIRSLAAREGLDLSACSAYSDSSNDIPMLSAVGNPVAVNPDSTLRAHARENNWVIRDFRRRAQLKEYSTPSLSAASGIALGLAIGYAIGRRKR